MGRRDQDYRILRYRQEEVRTALERRRPRMRAGVPTMLVQVFNGGSMPSSAGGNSGKFFDCHPATVTGTETEGGTGSFTTDSSVSQPVLFIGSRLPLVGEYHIARFLDWLWVVESGAGVFVNPCIGAGNFMLFTLEGCTAGPVVGASVTFTGPHASYSGTTNGSGQVNISEPAPGTYTIAWSFSGYSGTTSATVTNSCFNATAGDNLQAYRPAGYKCFCTTCIFPMPPTVHLTDVNGTIALNQPVVGIGNWQGSYTVTVGGTTYIITYTLLCGGTLFVSWCNSPTGNPARDCPPSGVCTECSSIGGASYGGGTVPPCITDAAQILLGNTCANPFPTLSGTTPGVGVCDSANPVTGGVLVTL